MRYGSASPHHARTTPAIDAGVLAELERLKDREGRSLGAVASDLLARALASPAPAAPELQWISKPPRPRADLVEGEAPHRLLDGASLWPST